MVRIYFILAVAMVSVSTTSLVVRYLSLVPALTLAFWRMFYSSLFLWVYSYGEKQKITKKNKAYTVFAGVFLGLHFALFFLGVRNTSVASATLLANTGPVFTSFFSFVSGNRIEKSVWIGLFFALVGVSIVQGYGITPGENNTFGNFLSLSSGLCMAITYLFAFEVRKETKNIIYGRSVFFVSSITIGVFSFLYGSSLLDFSLKDIPWFIFLGLVPSILGHNLLNYSIKYFSPTAISSIPLGEPIIASFFAFLLFSETIPVAAYLGSPFVFFGIYLILSNSKQQKN